MKKTAEMKNPGRNDPCWCGSGKKFKKCHMGAEPAQRRAAAVENPFAPRHVSASLIKTPAQIEGIRAASELTRDTLDMLAPRIGAGVTTNQIDAWVDEYTAAHGAIAAPLNYRGFPKSVCTSINEVVCHGIPEDRALTEGDIVNVDVTSVLDGFYGDSSLMFLVGEVSAAARTLCEVTRECLEIGIAQVRPGGHVGDIGHAIQELAEKAGYSVVRDFVGHGTGVRFHEEPQIPHFGRKDKGHPLLAGMVFTIEPMINAGQWPIRILEDRWTAVTADGSLSAQYEHTVLVTPGGVEVLTA